MKKSFTSLLIAMCMLMTLFTPFSVIAADDSFEPNYSQLTEIPSDWSGNGFSVANGSEFYGSGYDSEAQLIYNGKKWSNEIDYTWKNVTRYLGNAIMYFFYNDNNNYYALEMTENGSSIVKNVNGLKTVLGTDLGILANTDGKSIRIVRAADGKISVYAGNIGEVPSIKMYESTITDSSSPSGKIGIGISDGEGFVDGVKVVGAKAADKPAQSEYEKVKASYTLSYGDTLPAEWTGNTENFAGLGSFAYQHSGSGWGKNSVAVYDSINWTGDLTFTSRVNNNGSTAGVSSYLYFYYNDANNYYALSMGNDEATGIKLVKCVNGVKTELARSESYSKPQQGTWFTVKVSEDNKITVKSHENNNTVETIHFSDIADTTFTSGKIGFGWDGDSAWFGGVEVNGYKLVKSTSGGDDKPISFKEVFSENFDNITTEEWSKWKAITGGTNIMADGGVLKNTPYSGLNAIKYTGCKPEGTYKLNMSISNNNGGQKDNCGMILFNLTNDNKGYAVIEKGGDCGEFVLARIDGNYWEPVVLETAVSKSAAWATVNYEIFYEKDGYITVDATYGGSTVRLFDRVKDTTYGSGNVGAAFRYSEFWFDNMVISEQSESEENPTPTPTTPATEKPTVTTEPVHFEPNYMGSAKIPTGWSGNAFKIENNPNWPAFIGSAYNSSGKLIYDGYIWEQNVDYTWQQLNGYNGTALLYFWYKDDENYYALELKASGTRVVKVKNGKETVLGSDSTPLVNIGKDAAVRVAYANDGTITVYGSTTGNCVPTNILYSVKDTTDAAPKGKIGIGVNNGGGHFCYVVADGIATNVIIEEPTPTTTPTPTPTPSATPPVIAADTVYEGYDTDSEIWSGSGFEVGSWKNYQFNSTSGKLILDKYIWKNAVDYSFTQISVNGADCEGIIYFMYQNDDNYYALKITSQGGEIAKVNEGVYSVLASTSEQLKDIQYSLRIVREANGVISVWKGAKDSTVQTNKIMETEPDTTFTAGKIGMGYTGRVNGTQWYVAPTIKGTTGNAEEPIPVRTLKPVSASADAITVNANDADAVRKLGRAFDKNNAVNLTWSLSGIEFMAYNAKDIYLNVKTDTMLALSIDDKPAEHIRLDGFKDGGYAKIAEFTSASNHKIRIVKEFAQDSNIVLTDIKVTGNAPSLKATRERQRKIEFVGDSITVGSCMFNDYSVNKHMGTNAMINYAGQTAAYFGADVSMTAVGGSGFVTDDMDSLCTYRYYDYAIQPNAATGEEYKWDFTQYRPDVVVVNIGTNGGAKTTKDMYIRFYNQIRDRYNDTKNEITILFALGAINQDAWPNLHAAYEELKKTDNNVYELQLGDKYCAGVAAHPDLEQQTKMADVLINYLKEIMPGWDKADISAGAYNTVGTGVTVPYRVLNNTDKNVTGNVMVALYNRDGVLIGIEKNSVTFDAEKNIVNDAASFKNVSGAVSAKIFMWDNSNVALAADESIEF